MSSLQSVSRRQFLRGALALGAGAALGTRLLSPAMPALANGMAPIRSVPSAGRLVALTYDDLWSEFYTLRIARACHKRGIRVTLFPVGQAVRNNLVRPHKGYEDMYAKMRDMGHEIGCHLYTHRDIRDFDLEQLVEEEMEPSLEALRKALGADFQPVGIRPPYGVMTDAVRELSDLYGIPLILWGVDSRDAFCQARLDCDTACRATENSHLAHSDSSPASDLPTGESSHQVACTKAQCEQLCVEQILANVERLLRPGSIVLNHGLRNTYLALLPMLDLLRRRNLQPVALTELLAHAS